jgi:hypothetical protein
MRKEMRIGMAERAREVKRRADSETDMKKKNQWINDIFFTLNSYHVRRNDTA